MNTPMKYQMGYCSPEEIKILILQRKEAMKAKTKSNEERLSQLAEEDFDYIDTHMEPVIAKEWLDKQIDIAKQNWKDNPPIEIDFVKYSKQTKRLVIHFLNGTPLVVSIPVFVLQGLTNLSDKEMKKVKNLGTAISFDKQDIQFSAEGLQKGIYGTKEWMGGLKLSGLFPK